MDSTIYYITADKKGCSLNSSQWELMLLGKVGHSINIERVTPSSAENRQDILFTTLQAIQGRDVRTTDGGFLLIPNLLSGRCKHTMDAMAERIQQEYVHKNKYMPTDVMNCLADMGKMADMHLALNSPLLICYENKVLSLRNFILQESRFLMTAGMDKGIYFISDMRSYR